FSIDCRRGDRMKRREFVAIIASMAAWPRAADAQQRSLPIIGFVDPRSVETMGNRLRGFRRGLEEGGYTEDHTVTVEYRWGENRMDRLPELAADLAHRGVDIIVASGGLSGAFAAKQPRRRFRSCSSPPKTRSSWGWSAVLPDPAAI